MKEIVSDCLMLFVFCFKKGSLLQLIYIEGNFLGFGTAFFIGVNHVIYAIIPNNTPACT